MSKRTLVLAGVLGLLSCESPLNAPRRNTAVKYSGGLTSSLPAAGPPVAYSSPEYRLAYVERGGFVAADDPAVATFRHLLDQLSSKYEEDSRGIADMTVAAQKGLRQEGVEERILNITEGLNEVIVGPHGLQSYTHVAAAYVRGRSSGLDHRATIGGIMKATPM